MFRSNFQDVFDNLLPALDGVYFESKYLDETDAPWEKLFSMRKSKRQFENVTGISGFPTFGTVGEGQDVPVMSISQLYDKKFTHVKYAGAWQITEEMEDDDQVELTAGLASAFARSFRFTKEVNFANVLNNGFTTELAADGVALFGSRTLLSGGTLNNSAATDFGVSTAQTMFNHFATLTDAQGLRIKLAPSYIVANPAMRWIIGETLRSQYRPATAVAATAVGSDLNAINVLSEETLKEIYWAELTDTDAWFVLAKPSDVDGYGLRGYNRTPFTVSNDFNVGNLTMVSVGRGRWSRGVIDPRQAYGSTGA
jgi:hypothetical protein